MKAADLMTRRVVTTRPGATVAEAIHLMLQNRISGLPVVDGDQLVGIVTEGDFMRRGETGTERHRPHWLEFLLGPTRLADEYVRSHGRKVADVMTRDVATVSEDTPAAAMVELMEKRRVRRLPVLRNGKLVGIVTRSNLLRVVARMTAKVAPALAHSFANDRLIRDCVLAELDKQPWAPRDHLVEVVVWDGVVHLRGVIFDEKERQALRVLAECTPGVDAVEDHLECLPPIATSVL